jgi:hypothetical protein
VKEVKGILPAYWLSLEINLPVDAHFHWLTFYYCWEGKCFYEITKGMSRKPRFLSLRYRTCAKHLVAEKSTRYQTLVNDNLIASS